VKRIARATHGLSERDGLDLGPLDQPQLQWHEDILLDPRDLLGHRATCEEPASEGPLRHTVGRLPRPGRGPRDAIGPGEIAELSGTAVGQLVQDRPCRHHSARRHQVLDDPALEKGLGLAGEGRFPARVGLGRPAVVLAGLAMAMEAQERHGAIIRPQTSRGEDCPDRPERLPVSHRHEMDDLTVWGGLLRVWLLAAGSLYQAFSGSGAGKNAIDPCPRHRHPVATTGAGLGSLSTIPTQPRRGRPIVGRVQVHARAARKRRAPPRRKVVDHADEPGEAALEEDRLGREAGLGGMFHRGVGDLAAADHDVPGQAVHCGSCRVRPGLAVSHGGDVGFVHAVAGQHGRVECHAVAVVHRDADRESGDLAQGGIELGAGNPPAEPGCVAYRPIQGSRRAGPQGRAGGWWVSNRRWRVGGGVARINCRTLGPVNRRERGRGLAVAAAVVVGVVVPGIRMLASSDAPDGIPLSTYPMFTRDPGRVVEQPTVVAVSPEGEIERLSPETIAGTDQVMQAAMAVRQAVGAGPAPTRALCAEVAGRVDAPATVAVVVERYDAIAWSEGDGEPFERRTVVACKAGP
jgi:hypothetical protein